MRSFRISELASRWGVSEVMVRRNLEITGAEGLFQSLETREYLVAWRGVEILYQAAKFNLRYSEAYRVCTGLKWVEPIKPKAKRRTSHRSGKVQIFRGVTVNR
jgi:hypothetical protein